MYYIMMFLFLIMGFILFFVGIYMINYNYMIFMDWELLSLNSSSVTMVIVLDWMSMIFSSVVLLISSMILMYSCIYMEEDKFYNRFLYLIMMFVMSMLLLINSPNLISILLGWDGLGLVSYGLVIYYQNNKSYNAGMLTILMNRVGDTAMLMAIAWMMNYGSWHFLFYLNIWDNKMLLIILMVILASFTKSAQIPFSSWLPAAMAAPTPVSALVHSSTLVTAGIYLLIRFNNVLENMNCNIFIFISLMTMFMAGLGANLEFDLKKIIALSTLSQLGLMMVILFMKFSILSFFHLLNHAFFKALLFLCAGLMIHSMNNNQDLRFMGGFYNSSPWTYSCFLISNFSLCGFPFVSGFYSKDLIMESINFSSYNFYILLILYLSMILTVSYSIRLIYYSLGNNCYCYMIYVESKPMIYSMLLLMMMSIMSGSLLSWLIFSFPNLFLLKFELKLLPLIMIFMSSMLTYTFCNMKLLYKNYVMSFFIASMWFMPDINFFLTKKLINNSSILMKNIDFGWGEYFFSRSIYEFLVYLSKNSINMYNNSIKLMMVAFILSSSILLM